MKRFLRAVFSVAVASISLVSPAQARLSIFHQLGIASGVPNPVNIQDCAAGSACVILVQVRKHGIHGKRCELTIDPAIVIVRGNAARDLEWQLDKPVTDFRFDPKVGIDVLGDDAASPANREFDDYTPGTSGGKSNYKVRHRKQGGNGNLAYNYNVTVQQNDGGNWAQCGFIDPIIVNRP